jgi:hypothetical protein
MKPELSDLDVTQVRFDYAVSFLTEDRSLLRIQTPFTLTDLEGTIEIEPADTCAVSGRILALLHNKIEQFTYDSVGNLLLESVAVNIRLHVPPNSDFEAWTLSKRDNTLLVCKIGGGVAVWPPIDADGEGEAPPSG